MAQRKDQQWVAGSAPLLAAINRNIVKLLELNGFTIETVDNQK
jgi:hypothetical protein